MNSTGLSNPYQVLGVSANSSHEEIKRTYQRLVLKVHPDKLDGSLSQEDRDKAYERFLAIDKAWKVLNNQETRADCDKQLKEQDLSQDWPVSDDVDLDDMEYHEDTESYSSLCRCSGKYVLSEEDLENGHNIVCCSNCTLCIRVLYNVVSDDASNDL
ncbi:dnaJ homolog subfamily C member 24-like [Stylophora pistillata]|uniref:dnaJ homolog subfamily C member 24-like n=1 Tax=Stylophora pistillata TaxID=50429 RepID=UPI000C03F14E|nr:dnaJ homolog subfamily C member 24-like [Stylophora pistillata]